jgi:DNA-binding response OmpR family regulator
MQKIILCIDDSPERYGNLAKFVSHRGITVIVTCRMEEVIFYTDSDCSDCYEIIGVCLDHDMPFQDGMYFAINHLREKSWPVAITSMNPSGAENMFQELSSYETPCTKIPAGVPFFTSKIANFFHV